MKVQSNLLNWFHHTVECAKIMRFTATYYIETSKHHRHSLDRKITGSYKQYVAESVNKTRFQLVREGFPTLFEIHFKPAVGLYFLPVF